MNELLTEVRTMVDQWMQGEEDIASWVRTGGARAIQEVVKLPGDASTRKYYRLHSKDRSYILMRMESFLDQGMDLPFLNVQKHMATSGIDVPVVLDVDPGRGFILLEDLGDVTLLRRLQDVSSPDVERHLYERVIDGLVHLQVHASPARHPSPGFEPYRLRFDHEKLMWEVNFAIEHFYEKHLNRAISPEDRQVLHDGFSEICTILADEPTVFTHRDFHSRNVMVAPGRMGTGAETRTPDDRFVMIDFQDARMGPAQYDLASLLKDSYYQLEEAQVDRLLDYYIARYEAVAGVPLNRQQFRTVFDLMSVQRNFKAIGSFASFLNRRGNATYLKYVGNTFENIRRTLLKYPRYARLREILFHYYYF